MRPRRKSNERFGGATPEERRAQTSTVYLDGRGKEWSGFR